MLWRLKRFPSKVICVSNTSLFAEFPIGVGFGSIRCWTSMMPFDKKSGKKRAWVRKPAAKAKTTNKNKNAFFKWEILLTR